MLELFENYVKNTGVFQIKFLAHTKIVSRMVQSSRVNSAEGVELLSESELFDSELIHFVQEFGYSFGHHSIGIIFELGLNCRDKL